MSSPLLAHEAPVAVRVPQAPVAAPVAPGRAAVRAKGWWRAQRLLVLRRLSQLAILGLFLLGPLAGVWIVKGSLAASLALGVLPLTDPLVLAQVLATRHWPETTAFVGAGIVIAFYAVAGGRTFCSWVCPVNLATDGAQWLRRRVRLVGGRAPAKSVRWWLLAAVLVASAASGTVVWEFVNPVTLTQRAIVFGGSLAWTALAAVFVYDLLIAPRGWCGHLCPVGAAYALIGSVAPLRVAAAHASRCDGCNDCYAVCPEPQVITGPLKGRGGASPVIADRQCTNCGRCIDVCAPEVFRFTHRLDHRRD